MKNLNLKKIRLANIERHNEWPGSDNITLSFRGLELAGEVGELCNYIKKLVRLVEGIQGTTEETFELMESTKDEMADVLISLDLLAMHLNIDLAEATTNKFNKTSEKHGMVTRL